MDFPAGFIILDECSKASIPPAAPFAELMMVLRQLHCGVKPGGKGESQPRFDTVFDEIADLLRSTGTVSSPPVSLLATLDLLIRHQLAQMAQRKESTPTAQAMPEKRAFDDRVAREWETLARITKRLIGDFR